MERDTTLDDFIEDGPEDRADEESGAQSEPDRSRSTDSDALEPGAAPDPTGRWQSDGAACQSCDAMVSRLWRSNAGLVCGDCKEW